MLGPLLVGVIYDSQHSYKMAGIAAGTSVIISGLIVMFIHCYMHKRKNAKEDIDQ